MRIYIPPFEAPQGIPWWSAFQLHVLVEQYLALKTSWTVYLLAFELNLPDDALANYWNDWLQDDAVQGLDQIN
jgi:hypothetical protein